MATVLNTTTTLTGTQTFDFDCSDGISSVFVELTGLSSGELFSKGTTDGINYFDIYHQDYILQDGQIQINFSYDGIFTMATGGLKGIRFTANSISSTPTLRISGTEAASMIHGIENIVAVTVTGTLPLPTDAATETTLAAINAKLVSGTDIGDVTINNASGGSAVNIQDGGNTITVDGTVALSAGSAVIGHVITDTGSTTAVTGNVTVVQPTGTNLHTVIDSGTTTVTQATGSNLHTVVDSGTITTVSTVTNLSQLGGAAISMNTGVRDAGTQRVTIATNDSLAVTLAAGATSIGKAEDTASVTADVGVPAMAIRKATPANLSDTDGDYEMLQMSAGRLWTSSTIDAALPAGNNNIGDVDIASITPPTLTKGTQGSTGFSTQDLKDGGRTHINYYAVAAASGATTVETAITLTKSSGTSATSTGTSFVVTSGKRFRIEYLSFATRGNSTATIQTTTFNFRINTAGAVITSSTPIVLAVRSATPATASAWDRVMVPIPDGFEILGDGTLQFGITAAATFTTNAPTWDVTLIGYEY